MDLGHLLFSFGGRINRAKYWLAALIYICVNIALLGIIVLINSPRIGGVVNIIVSLAIFISALAVAAKRLHDRNRSAWMLLLFYIVPSILVAIGIGAMTYSALGSGSTAVTAIGWLFVAGGIAISIWAFVELGCLRGTVGPNQYGPDPLEGKV